MTSNQPPSLCIVGDALLDCDVSGAVRRVCPDAPAPVVEVDRDVVRPGGAGLAAVLARRHVGHVTLITALGDDAAGSTVTELLRDAGVDLVDLGRSRPTMEKVRVRSANTSLVRYDRGGRGAKLLRWDPSVDDILTAADAILVSDYAGGVTASPRVRAAVTAAASARPVVWDPHPDGRGPVPATQLLTPSADELGRIARIRGKGHEFRLYARAATRFAKRSRIGAVAVTLGARGALLVRPDAVPFVVPAPLVSGNDPIGAGDCFAVAATHALATGSVVTEAVESAVAAAAAFVGAGGVAGVDHVIADGAADAPAARVHAAGGTVVATGGCFDLMHAGHVALLQAARALGDCLVVLVNSDASVRRLKGRDRPYQTAADRAAVLRALACVDDVIVFDEDTPVDALERLRPEVFVKGADYSIDQLVESEVVARWHGQTVVVPYLAGRSTSRLLERMDYPRGD